jgi:ribose transport system substrate-binding protein
MNLRRKAPWNLLTIFVILTLACPFAKAQETYTIAYIPGKKNAFYLRVEQGIRQKALEYNMKVILPWYPESWDGSEQIKILQSVFTESQPQLIAIAPASSQELKELLIDLHNQGIEIITIDRALENGKTMRQPHRRFPLLHISTDQWLAGKTMAVQIAELIDGKGKVYINSTFPDIPAISQRFKAFLKSLEEFPNITIIGIDVAGIDFSNSDKGVVGSSQELERNAHKQSLEIIQKHPDINAIFCTNDLSGKGIVKTILVTGLEGSVKIGVWDTTAEMVSAINSGIVDLALAQNPEAMGAAAVFWGNYYLQTGESIPAKLTIDFQLLTKSNTSKPELRQLVYQ